jgi:hypothetical protein
MITTMNAQGQLPGMFPEKFCDARMTTPIIPGYERQIGRKALLLHGCKQSVKLKKTMSFMQQRIVHDETSQFLCRLPATISKHVPQEQHCRDESGDPVEQAHSGRKYLIDVQNLASAGEHNGAGGVSGACKERILTYPNMLQNSLIPLGLLKDHVVGQISSPEGQAGELVAKRPGVGANRILVIASFQGYD